jgi:hypothetical protein
MTPKPKDVGRDITLEYNETEHCYLMLIGDQRIRYTPPRFTESLDAAMTLARNDAERRLMLIAMLNAFKHSDTLERFAWLKEGIIAALTAISKGAEHG